MSDREKLVELMIEAKKANTEDAPFSEFLADFLIANGVTVQKWIPVTERLPEYGERVLITEGSCVFEASMSISHKWVRCGIGWAESVTHWMPLPEPPKEEV